MEVKNEFYELSRLTHTFEHGGTNCHMAERGKKGLKFHTISQLSV